MKTELVNFISDLPVEAHNYNLPLDEGLYVFIDLDKNGNLKSFEKEVFEKGTAMMPFFSKCLVRKINSEMPTSNKRYNQSFEIGSPFGIGFKKDILFESLDTKTGKKKGYSEQAINDKIDAYLQVAEIFLNSQKAEHSENFIKFKLFCKNHLIIFSQQLFLDYKRAKAIFIFLDKVLEEDFRETHEKYLSERGVFNDPKSAITFNDKKYQVSDILNGFGIKKMFLEHKTAPFTLNLLITDDEAIKIFKFFSLVSNKILPNPCPIFIDKRELNGKVIALLQEDNRISYSKVIIKLFEEYSKDIGNYYLLFFQIIPQKGYRVVDLDFVPSFKYDLEDMIIVEVFPLGGKITKQIKNVFQFERDVANNIFNNQLITETKAGGLWLKYFGDIEYNPKYITDNTYNQLLKYRKAFYDYIYKSKRESIQNFMFHDIMLNGVLDDIRVDQYKDRNHTKEYSIKEKLNIWFSLYNYFNTTKSKIDMINKTRSLLEKVKLISQSETQGLESDSEFAFASGQLIRYLLGQSEVGDRSHALLEPFLQKTDPNLYKLAIARVFETYKHAIPFYKGNARYSFDRIMSEVMGFEPDNINMKDLLPLILAGYFSETIFKKSEQTLTV